LGELGRIGEKKFLFLPNSPLKGAVSPLFLPLILLITCILSLRGEKGENFFGGQGKK